MAMADIINLWKQQGVFEFYLPFVLMFAIFYGLLSKSKIFGDQDKERRVRGINVVISIVAALFIMVSPVGVSMTTFFGTFFTQTMVVLTTILVFAMIFYMIIPAGSVDAVLKDPSKYVKYLAPFAVLAAIVLFLASGAPAIFGIRLGGVGGIGLPWLGLTSEDIVTIFLILVFVGLVVYMTRGGAGEDQEGKKYHCPPEGYEWDLVPKKRK
jgi:hypothetical protein